MLRFKETIDVNEFPIHESPSNLYQRNVFLTFFHQTQIKLGLNVSKMISG